MLKYVAVLKVDKPILWSRWHAGPTWKYVKSPVEDKREKVEKWLEKELKKYPDARINEKSVDREYFIKMTIIAFDEEQSDSVESFLESMIPF